MSKHICIMLLLLGLALPCGAVAVESNTEESASTAQAPVIETGSVVVTGTRTEAMLEDTSTSMEVISATKKDKLLYILPTTDSPHIKKTLKSYYSYANSWNHNEKWSKIEYYQDSMRGAYL